MTWPEYQASCCRLDNVLTRMGPTQAEVLCILLLAHPDTYITREEMIGRLWPNPDDEPESVIGSYVHVYMSRLRLRGIVIATRNHNYGPIDYGGWRIPREARGRPERLARLAA